MEVNGDMKDADMTIFIVMTDAKSYDFHWLAAFWWILLEFFGDLEFVEICLRHIKACEKGQISCHGPQQRKSLCRT